VTAAINTLEARNIRIPFIRKSASAL